MLRGSRSVPDCVSLVPAVLLALGLLREGAPVLGFITYDATNRQGSLDQLEFVNSVTGVF
jgi:hypothetical protein